MATTIWMESRCGSVCSETSENWQMPENCHQTVRDGGFFSRALDAKKHFKSQGWREIDDEWWCPVCVKLLSEGK